jgi:hypothetical protein
VRGVLRRRRVKAGGLFEVLYAPAKPTLHGALAYANKLAFGHALGFAPERWRPPRSGRLERLGRAAGGQPCAYVQLLVGRGFAGPLPSVTVSAPAAEALEEVRWGLRLLRSATGSVFLYAEVAGIPLTLEGDDVPWPALARGREGLYVPGFEAFTEALAAEREGRQRLVLCDWRRWEPEPERRIPSPARMLLALVRCGDGRVAYVLWVSRGGMLWS